MGENNKLYHDTKKLLQSYRNQKMHLKVVEAGLEKGMLDYAKNFEWEIYANELEYNQKLLEIENEVLNMIKNIPEDGEKLYYILYKKYFEENSEKLSDERILELMYREKIIKETLSKTTFYRYQKKAIQTYGQILWGALDNSLKDYREV